MSGPVLYVYAVTASHHRPRELAGLDGLPLRVVESGPVEAIYSEHEVVPEPDEDLLWAHEQVVEGLMKDWTLLPMRFASTVDEPQALALMLEQRRDEFLVALERVQGAIELSVRAQLSSEEEEETGEQLSIAPGGGPGTAFLFERARRHRHAESLVDLIHQPLALLARRSLLKPRHGSPREFKAAYLVEKGMVEDFGRRVSRLNATLGDVRVSCTGPWPPYSFVEEEDDPG